VGDEIHFEILVADEQALDAREEMEVGELGYWPVGRAFCRVASPVNVLAK